MDVRCEKCGTEYELDESRLKPGGVTVKCTTCGHMFKIRKRANTNLGVPATGLAPASNRSARADGVPRPQSQTGSGPNADRNWLIRLINAEGTMMTRSVEIGPADSAGRGGRSLRNPE